MKTTGMCATTVCLLSILAAGPVKAQDTKFVLANNTEFTVYAVHIWPTYLN